MKRLLESARKGFFYVIVPSKIERSCNTGCLQAQIMTPCSLFHLIHHIFTYPNEIFVAFDQWGLETEDSQYWNSGVSRATYHWKSCETLPFQDCNPVSGLSVQYGIGTRSPEMTEHEQPSCSSQHSLFFLRWR